MATNVKVTGYEAPGKMKTLSHRVAHFLNWGAQHMPYVYFSYNVIVREINGFTNTPRHDNPQVDAVRKCMQSVKRIMLRDSGRGFHAKKNEGVRATVDDLDKIEYDMVPRQSRINSSVQVQKQVASTVKHDRLPATERGKILSKFLHGVKNEIRFLEEEKRIMALLPEKSKK
jgi:hypothetical protein